MAGIFPLRGVLKNYEWGGKDFISRLCGIDNKKQLPFAEYWMGIHSQGSSQYFSDGQWYPLTDKLSSLPFLLKILDVREMLSIQVHPDRKGAREGFEKENAAGIPLDAPQRNYRDGNHKPELMVALGEFWLLHGFKDNEGMTDILTNVEVLNELLPLFNEKGYEGLYHHVMRMPQAEVNRILQPLKDELGKAELPNKYEEDHWAQKAFRIYDKGGDLDRGIFSIYFFNLLNLKKGEGIFQGAGLPHAYLEGQNIEIMANSDNVLRGGLTTKHIDVEELLKHVKCEPSFPRLFFPDNSTEFHYKAPVDDFDLHALRLLKGEKHQYIAEKDQIVLPVEGETKLASEGMAMGVNAGHPVLLTAGSPLILEAGSDCWIFIAE